MESIVARMPTVDDLRMLARETFANYRKETKIVDLEKLKFCQKELDMLGYADVYDEEFRRSELIENGFHPPEKIKGYSRDKGKDGP